MGLHVSIQLLLLFYNNVLEPGEQLAQFQYNSCYCSIDKEWMKKAGYITFQYNFCYCSMQNQIDEMSTKVEFQYNFCYCSI